MYSQDLIGSQKYLILSDINLFKKILPCLCKSVQELPQLTIFGALPYSLLTNCVHSSQYILKPFKASSSGGQTSNSRNVSTSYNSHAATSTHASAASNRGYYNNHINYQYYNNDRPQNHQHSSNNNKQNNYNQNKARLRLGVFHFNNIILNTYSTLDTTIVTTIARSSLNDVFQHRSAYQRSKCNPTHRLLRLRRRRMERSGHDMLRPESP